MDYVRRPLSFIGEQQLENGKTNARNIKNRDSDKNPGFYIIAKFYILSRIDCKLSEKYFVCNKTILSFISPLLIRVSICSLSSFSAALSSAKAFPMLYPLYTAKNAPLNTSMEAKQCLFSKYSVCSLHIL